MRILVLHLSDMHITTAEDPLLARAAAIAAATATLAEQASAILVMTTGDIAFSGSTAQYALAETFFSQLTASLSEELTLRGQAAPIYHAIVPGNHDCDFSDVPLVREIVMDKILADASTADDPSVISLCTDVQRNFTIFAEKATTGGSTSQTRLLNAYRFQIADANIHVFGLNTAWISRKHEQQGRLFMPPSVVPDLADDSLTIVAFHHPYNWLESNNARAFRKRVESIADIVLTGHEHDAGSVIQERARGQVNTYVEGGVLQDSSDPDMSEFNVLLIDTILKKQAVSTFRFDGTRFTRGPEGAGRGLLWEDFRPNRTRMRTGFFLSDSHRRNLEDPGANIVHAALNRQVRLPEVFVFPDIRQTLIQPESDAFATLIRGDEAVEFFSRANGIHLITGDSQAGKSALAKMLTLRLWERGDVPVLVDGRDITAAEKIGMLVENTFARQYDPADREAFRQLSPSRRIIIVDDYHLVRGNAARKDKILKSLEFHASRVVLIAHEMLQGVESLARPDASSSFSQYRMQPLGHLRRNRLVERWLELGHDASADTTEFVRNLTEITRTLDTLIGTNFVPAYPAYVLAVLQATEAATPIDTRASTHGYFYELFIRTTLAKGRTARQYDILMAYLAHVAYSLFERRVRLISKPELEKIHASYVARHDIKLSFEDILPDMLAQRIWVVSDDEIGFRYRYLLYYFCAAYIRDHIGAESTRNEIRTMANALHVEDNSNILLFLAHLSRDPLIIDEVLNAAQAMYPRATPARLEADVEFLAEFTSLNSADVVFEDANVLDQRRAELEELDRVSTPQSAEFSASDAEAPAGADPSDPLVRLSLALKTVEILGQIAKNFPGSLEGDIKARIVTECYNLGLRTLGSIYEFVSQHKQQIVQDFAALISRDHPRYSRDKIVDRAGEAIVGLAALSAVGMVKRISRAVGSQELDATYDRVEDATNPAHLLVRLSILLDQAGAFPMARVRALSKKTQGRALALWVARAIAIHHFRLFPVEIGVKQRACAELGIKYEQVEPAFVSLKLLKPSGGRP